MEYSIRTEYSVHSAHSVINFPCGARRPESKYVRQVAIAAIYALQERGTSRNLEPAVGTYLFASAKCININ
jgi:hypothetical protein